ncbi:hypothetical protein MY11210_007267 [Beauveria gryllotalpidicola]
MHQPKQSTDTAQFVLKTLRPLTAFTSPGVTDSVLAEYHATVTALDFASGTTAKGVPVNGPRTLLRLMGTAAMTRAIDETTPWLLSDAYLSFYNFTPTEDIFNDEPYYHHRNAKMFADIVDVYLRINQDEMSADTLLNRTSWDFGGQAMLPMWWPSRSSDLHMKSLVSSGSVIGDENTDRWLGHYYNDSYIWEVGPSYMKLLPSGPGKRCPDPSKPHVISHVIDSTPWKSGKLRTSEFKTILFIAFVNKLKPAYEASDNFAVTVLSFWNWEVRIVQGLVNFTTRAVDIRVSSIQNFQGGFRNKDGSIDPRFLTLMAYACGEALPLSFSRESDRA